MLFAETVDHKLQSNNIDTTLTLSILRNSLHLMPFHVRTLEDFDTLSVYRGPLCEQAGGAMDARSASPHGSIDMKNQTDQKFNSRAVSLDT